MASADSTHSFQSNSSATNAAQHSRNTYQPPHESPGSERTRTPLPGSRTTAPTSLLEAERARQVMGAAEEAFAKTGSWVVFYREILGREGVARKAFPDADQFEQFRKTPQYAELQEMVAALRSQDQLKADATEPEKMITIRLPKSLHDTLTDESNELNLSINKLCISKLLQRIESRYVPVQQGGRRGRRPGPQGPRTKSSEK